MGTKVQVQVRAPAAASRQVGVAASRPVGRCARCDAVVVPVAAGRSAEPYVGQSVALGRAGSDSGAVEVEVA